MQIWRSLDDVPGDLGRTLATIGNFDGLHRGHQHVVRRAREIADGVGVPLVVITFHPHPMAVLRPDHAPQMLTDIPTRARLLGEYGADDVLVLPFSREMASWTPAEFIDRVLVKALHAQHVLVGSNFRFGNRASGDVGTLRAAGAEAGFEVESIELDGGPQVWSSTYVRTCLADGDVEGAAEALGRVYEICGSVVKGDQRGRELGFPTANLATELAVPGDGVYAGWLTRRDTGERFPAAISVGTNPTFAGERQRRAEAYVLDRDDLDLYGVEVSLSFDARIRGMVRFDGVEPLLAQMREDVARTRELLG